MKYNGKEYKDGYIEEGILIYKDDKGNSHAVQTYDGPFMKEPVKQSNSKKKKEKLQFVEPEGTLTVDLLSNNIFHCLFALLMISAMLKVFTNYAYGGSLFDDSYTLIENICDFGQNFVDNFNTYLSNGLSGPYESGMDIPNWIQKLIDVNVIRKVMNVFHFVFALAWDFIVFFIKCLGLLF